MHIRSLIILLCALAPLVAFGAGCSHEQPLPPAADLVGSGPGQLTFTAYGNGKVYLYDTTDRKKVYTSGVLRGDTYLADPARDVIEVSGRQEDHSTHLSADHSYRLYFERSY